jgi:Uma2 family endonuclease
VRTVPGRRSRVPDICVTKGEPAVDVFEDPPLIAVEILSRRDEMTDVLEKLTEYEEFGIRYISLLDPRRKLLYTYRQGRLESVNELAAGDIVLRADEAFHRV